MTTLNLTNSTNLIDNTTHCVPSASSWIPMMNHTAARSEMRIVSLSSFEIILIAACSSFLTLIFAGLFNFLKLNITQQESAWRAPCKPNFDQLIQDTKQCYIHQEQKELSRAHANHLLHSASFPPHNRYYEVTSSAYAVFCDAIAGTERDGWIYQGVKKGVRRYKKDIDSSPFSLFRGEKILNYPQHVLLHAVRDKKIRIMIGDGQMKDCGALEVIDENCKVEFEEYRSPAPFVGAREFVYIDTIHRLPDDTIISFGRSVLHPSRRISDKFTRAQLKIGGWALMPIPDEKEKTKVVYLVRADLGGSLPSWLLNQITSDIPMTVERLNVSLSKLSAREMQRFDVPIMDVLLYGPKQVHTTSEEEGEQRKKDDESRTQLFEYQAASESQKQRFAQIIQRHGDLWSSDAYLELIPKEAEWVRRQPILIGGTLEAHEALLDRFVVPDKPFKYKSDVEAAFELFNTWRKWENGREWKEKAQKEDLKIYSHSVPHEAVDIIKGEAVIPFTVPIICGVLLNPYHRRKWDTKLDEVRRVGKASENTTIIYISVKTPTVFVTYRDMIAITWFYTFADGSMLLGSRSILHPSYPPKKTRVRATIHLDFWHIRPYYEGNVSHSKVTHYAHMSLGGSLPNWIVNEASVDIPSGIIKVRNYIQSISGDMHKAGCLYIPPFPFLKSLGIDIGWMDLDAANPLFAAAVEQRRRRMGREQEAKQEEEEEEEEKEEKATKEEMAMDVKEEEKHHAVPSSNCKSPAVHFVADRHRRLSQNDSASQHSSVPFARHKTPNYNLLMNQPQLQHTASIHSSLIKPAPPPPPLPSVASVKKESAIILRRHQWETGSKLKLREIKIANAALQSMSSLLLSAKKKKNEEQSISDADAQEAAVDARDSYRYELQSSLSVRDAASYMTLANCAVSELLQETDPSSKEYWVPSDAKTPRGIFVYKFIHSRERYYHYMGKAILHHEPKFIYDALCDPSFRFQYDQMLDEMQIIDKLDAHTYIARYLHTNKQCALIKQQRETVVVVRHRSVVTNDKYVAAGMSIEHKEYPTESGININTAAASDHDEEDIAKQLSGKGPSKSIHNGMLRTDVKSSGWVIERNVKKPSDSIVSYITNINFGGSVPSALLKSIAKKQPLAIYYLGKALKQRAKKIKQKRRQQRQHHIHQMQLQQKQKQQQLLHTTL